jgi:6-pyruvoyl-tetrahydropterin synthase
MLGPQDLTRLAQVIDPSLEKIELDVGHLDYSYVSTCTNVKELQMLLQVLKSGDEGYYPDLEEFIMKRMATLENIAAVDVNQLRTAVKSDLDEWVASISQTETRLEEDRVEPVLPRVRNSELEPARVATAHSERKDHAAWDKLNINDEIQKIDSSPLAPKPPAITPIAKSQVEREQLALTEKQKGNESFKLAEYQDAVLEINAAGLLQKVGEPFSDGNGAL